MRAEVVQSSFACDCRSVLFQIQCHSLASSKASFSARPGKIDAWKELDYRFSDSAKMPMQKQATMEEAFRHVLAAVEVVHQQVVIVPRLWTGRDETRVTPWMSFVSNPD